MSQDIVDTDQRWEVARWAWGGTSSRRSCWRGRSPTEIAGSHGISRSWIYELVRRFREGGYEALEPRSRRPHSCSHQVSADVQAAILGLRQELIAAGHDAGARTIAHHLQPLVEQVPSTATIWRILCRQGHR